jgi:hypothetical protein
VAVAWHPMPVVGLPEASPEHLLGVFGHRDLVRQSQNATSVAHHRGEARAGPAGVVAVPVHVYVDLRVVHLDLVHVERVAAVADSAAIGPVERFVERHRRKAHLPVVFLARRPADDVGQEQFADLVSAARPMEVGPNRKVVQRPPAIVFSWHVAIIALAARTGEDEYPCTIV